MSLETMTKLLSTTVSVGGAASITFSNIPQGYTDLKLVVSARTNTARASNGYYYQVTINGATTDQTSRYVNSNGTSTSNGTFSRLFGYCTPSDYTTGVFSNDDWCFTNYSNFTNKTIILDSVNENNASLSDANLVFGLWSNQSPITSLVLTPAAGSFVQYTTATIYGIKNARQTAGNSIKATGGNIVFDGTYVYHVFNSTGAFQPTQPLTVDYLVVAGGGGGGGAFGASINSYSGGGGAGGLYSSVTPTGGGGIPGTALSLVPTNYVITVGAGGAGGIGSASDGTNGSTSSFSTVTATGGGGGGGGTGTNTNDQGRVGLTGGSGGGASSSYLQNSPAGGSGTSNQGYAGGAGDNNQKSGGGGGAGGVGVSGSAGSTSNGGIGVISPLNPTGAYLAGGGGGARSSLFGTGGLGGGGSAGRNINGTAGTANTGGGGGGSNDESGSTSRTGGAGGSGIVIIRYKG